MTYDPAKLEEMEEGRLLALFHEVIGRMEAENTAAARGAIYRDEFTVLAQEINRRYAP